LTELVQWYINRPISSAHPIASSRRSITAAGVAKGSLPARAGEGAVSDLRQLAFTVEEYRRRVGAIQRLMAERGLDALLCHHFPNVCYLTGMEGVLWTKYYLAVVPNAGDPILLAEDFELPNARYCVWTDDLVGYDLSDDPVAATRRLLVERGLATKRLGIETRVLRVPLHDRLRTALPEATLLDASDLVDLVKVVKSEPEIAHLRHAARITNAGMTAALGAVAAGVFDQEVARAAYDALIGGGSEHMALDPIVTVGARSGIPHSTHRRVRIERGDTVLIELGANVHRYTAASFRCAVVGPPPAQVAFMADACLTSLDALIDRMRPGAVAAEIAAAVDRVWESATARYVWHGYYAYSLGIGFPIDWNDCPAVIKHGESLVLQPGMVFHCTTSLRETAKYGTAFSETVLVTESGPNVLTDVPRELVIA
jgi:Xaa-Pro dipeptidase